MKRGIARVRLTLDLSGRLNSKVEAAAKRRGCSKEAAVRAGVALLVVADQAKRDGFANVGAWKDEPKRRTERVFALGF